MPAFVDEELFSLSADDLIDRFGYPECLRA
jgi:hypothetical protein